MAAAWGAGLAIALIAGCTLGPNFHPPTVAPGAGYVGTHDSRAGAGQTALEYGGKVAADWYQLLDSSALDALVKAALARNPGLKAASARVQQGRAQLRAFNGGRWPQLQGRALANRAHINPQALGLPGAGAVNNNAFAGVLQLSYNLDVFGKLRRQIEAAGTQVAHSRAQALATYSDLVNQVVATALDAAAAQSLIDATQKLVSSQQQQLKIIKLQERVGTVARAPALVARARIESTQATLPPLRQRRAAARAALAALLGTSPAQFTAPTLRLSDLHVPAQLPVSLPSQLVAQRPDILAARALLHQASAEVGVAEAARLPSFSLSADYGTLANHGANFFDASNALWALGGNITAPLFNGGTLAAKQDAAEAALKAARYQYRATVLNAFADVATRLRALRNDADALAAHERALKTAGQALKLSRLQFRTGTADELQVLQAQQEYRRERVAQVGARSQRVADVAGLMHALGGGWWNAAKDPVGASVTDPVAPATAKTTAAPPTAVSAAPDESPGDA